VLAADIKVLVDARKERLKSEVRLTRARSVSRARCVSRALVAAADDVTHVARDLASGSAGVPISPLPVSHSAASAESGTAASADAGASGAGEDCRCACPGRPDGGASDCGTCESVVYCSRACQKLHWPAHKAACKAERGQVDE
jgi:hypothetical protein